MRSLILFPDEQVGWVSGATKAGLRLIREGGVNVIISSSPPESSHLVAYRLRRATEIPWVAEFRDPWSFSHVRPPGLLDSLHRVVEAHTLRTADALVTVNEGWHKRFRLKYPSLRHELIPNGFDEPDSGDAEQPRASCFRLLYTGKLDASEQDPTPLFAAVARAIASPGIPRDSLRLVFHCYGTARDVLERQVRATGVGPVFEWGGPLSHVASIESQRSGHVLLVFGWRRDPAWMPAKLFDYLGAGRRILYLGSQDSAVAGVLKRTGRGVTVESEADCYSVLVDWYQEWQRTGSLLPGGDPTAVAGYSFRRRTEEYDRLLRALMRGVARRRGGVRPSASKR